MEEAKKSKKLVWILILIILLAVSFIIYEKVLSVDKEDTLEPVVDEEVIDELEDKVEEAKDEDDEEEDEEIEEKTEEVDDEEVKELEEKIEKLEDAVADLEEENENLEEDVEDLEEAAEEEETPAAETEEEEEAAVTYEGESFITLTSPNESALFTIEPIEFTGTVSPNTEKIVVTATGGDLNCGNEGVCAQYINDTYTLQDFKVGDEDFVYRAKQDWDNLTGGINNYTFTAHFDDGSTESTSLNIELTGGAIVTIININSPANGSSFDSTSSLPIVFTGSVSKNATKIVVTATGGDPDCDNSQSMCTSYMEDIYTLEDFAHGDDSFIYRAKTEWDNLTLGENNYTFTAHFDGGYTDSETVSIDYNPYQ